MIIHKIEQKTDEWMALRLGKFTGSAFHLFLGNSEKKQTELLKKAAERITNVRCDSDIFSNKHIQRGNDLEHEAICIYELETNYVVNKVGFIELNEHVGCSPDGLINNDGILEIKCPDNHTFLKQKTSGIKSISPIYKTQMQFNMYVSNRCWCDYVCYNPNFTDNLYIERIDIDNEFVDKIICCIDDCNNKINKIIASYKSSNE